MNLRQTKHNFSYFAGTVHSSIIKLFSLQQPGPNSDIRQISKQKKSYNTNCYRHWPTIWRGGREYTHSIPAVKLEARIFFLSYFKGPSSQDQQKTLRRRLMTFKVTLFGQSHFTLIFVFRKVTLRGHINSVPWMYAVTPTPYYECTQFVDSVKSL